MTNGRDKLLSVLDKTKAEYMAARCQVTKGAVYHWRSGRNGPGPRARNVLNSTYGIDLTDWNNSPRR